MQVAYPLFSACKDSKNPVTCQSYSHKTFVHHPPAPPSRNNGSVLESCLEAEKSSLVKKTKNITRNAWHINYLRPPDVRLG